MSSKVLIRDVNPKLSPFHIEKQRIEDKCTTKFVDILCTGLI